ncbi:MAG: hypothetical protein ABW252_19390 [Polyangiales bacterium]
MPNTSSFMVGCDPTTEQRVAALIGDKPARFFALAQRIAWGTSQPDLVRVDVRATVARLHALHPRLFVTHLLAAFATRVSDPAQADASLVLARSLCDDEHPWRYLLPTDDEWSGKRSVERVSEVIADQVWRQRADRQVPGTPFYVASHATIVRTHGRELAIVNPVASSEASLAALHALGEVTTLVLQGRTNAGELARLRAAFPGARVVGTLAHLRHPASAEISFDGLIGTDSAELPRVFDALPVDAGLADEVMLLHRPTALLITHDLVASNRADDASRSFAGRLEDFAFGVDDRLGVPSFQPLLWNDLRALQLGLARVLATPFERVTGAHWPLALGADGLRDAYAAVLEHLCGLTRAQHAAMRLSYLWHQPAFLRDMLRNERRAKQAA